MMPLVKFEQHAVGRSVKRLMIAIQATFIKREAP